MRKIRDVLRLKLEAHLSHERTAAAMSVTARTVEVLHRGQRMASHLRCAHKAGFNTVPEHLSAAHRAHMQWTPERLSHWGNSIGAAIGSLVTRLLTTRKHPEQAHRACWRLPSALPGPDWKQPVSWH